MAGPEPWPCSRGRCGEAQALTHASWPQATKTGRRACVVLPLPVSPLTTATSCSASAATSAARVSVTGSLQGWWVVGGGWGYWWHAAMNWAGVTVL